jgi:hypothetical protein
MTANLENLAPRNIVAFSQGKTSFHLMDSLILLMNEKYIQGFCALLFGQRKKLA